MGRDLHWTQQQYDDYLRRHNLPPRTPEVIQHPEVILRHAKGPNKTEAEYGRILEAMKQRGEIIRYEFEGLTFRWLDMRYTPDWIVIYSSADARHHCFKAIEIKGAHIFDRDIVRFKGARALWPEIQFEMHQKKEGSWIRLF
jgi:hypothetical protein